MVAELGAQDWHNWIGKQLDMAVGTYIALDEDKRDALKELVGSKTPEFRPRLPKESPASPIGPDFDMAAGRWIRLRPHPWSRLSGRSSLCERPRMWQVPPQF